MDNRILILTLPLALLATALPAECGMIVEVEPSAFSLSLPDGSSDSEHDFALLSGPDFDIAIPEKSISVNLPPGITLIADRLLSTEADLESFNIILSTGEFWFHLRADSKPKADYLGVIATMPIAKVRTRLNTGVLVGFPFPDSGGPDPGINATETATLLYVGGGLLLVAVYRRTRQR
jgi:hypothetical protein